MKQGRVVPLDARLAILAAELSHKHQLRLADGIIYATACAFSAELLTQDADLEGLPNVQYILHPKRSSSRDPSPKCKVLSKFVWLEVEPERRNSELMIKF